MIPLLTAVLVVVAGAYFVGHNAIDQMLRADAEASARSWGRYIVNNLPEIETVLDGSAQIRQATPFFRAKEPSGNIVQYAIYDTFGIRRIQSGGVEAIMGDPPERNAHAANVLATSGVFFEFADIHDPSGTRRYAHLFVPFNVADREIGVLEVVSDETESWGYLREQFGSVATQVGALILLAFFLPGLLYLRRTGQLEFISHRLKRTAENDELTGALNRSTFSAAMLEQIEAAKRDDMAVAVHFIDLDRFKAVNDTRGHAIGDAVLVQATDRLRNLLGMSEILARFGGDEFAICQPYIPDAPEKVDKLANAIVRDMAVPFNVDGAEVQIGASLGYAHYPSDGKSVAELIRAADIALSRVKEKHRGRALAFDRTMEAERRERQHIEERVRRALAFGEFALNYQPFFDAADGRLRGFEALLRLSDDDGKPISPAVFIPIAEEAGLIGEIGQWVLRAATSTAAAWPDDISISVNLSPAQFHSHNMARTVEDVLRATGLKPSRLELEVTEGLLIMDTENVLKELTALKRLGVSIALDDFGTGYSSLAYLWQFPFGKLKVDKSFVFELGGSGGKSREILATVVALGKVLGLKITAEGVETEEQLDILRELGCDLVQGFLLGRPMASDALQPLLAAGAAAGYEVEGHESARAELRSA